jgi:hypothetical protein
VRAVAVGGEVGHLVRRCGRRGAGGADEGEVPDAGLDEDREGGRVGGEDVEVGGESEGRVGRGAQRAQAGATSRQIIYDEPRINDAARIIRRI